MIPYWLLTILHYASVTAAVVILVAVGWHYARPRSKNSKD